MFTALFPVRALAAGTAALVLCPATPALADNGIRPDATMLQFPDVSADTITFVYANDIWTVPREGGTALRVASPPGREMFPRFSPDGGTIAFVGNYEGDQDLYTIPTGGSGLAYRVTHHPGNEMLCDWTPDGDLLYSAGATVGLPAQSNLYTVDDDGGLPSLVPVPYGAAGAISADGTWLAYTPHSRDFRTWKRYRGGMATDIWLFNLNDHTSRRITDWEGTDTQPMWHGDTVYYLSDAGDSHRLNIWSYDVSSGDREQVTRFDEHDVKWPSIGPEAGGGEIVFQNGSRLHVLDLRSRQSKPIDIVIPGDRPTLRSKQVDYAKYMQGGDVSATGKCAVVEARGDLFTVPAEEGVTRALTRTSGVAERNPVWSPDGRWIAYLSDESGEYEVYIRQSDGRGDTRQLTSGGTTYRYLLTFSPDSAMIAMADATGSIDLIDVETGETTHVATDPWAQQDGVSFSHDSKWLTFALADDANNNGVIHLFDIEAGELHAVTSPMFGCGSPAFDREGKFLYYTSTRNFSPTYSNIDTTFIYQNSNMLLAVPLNADVENPWLPENEEEEWEEDDEDEEEGEEGEEGEEDAASDDDESEGEDDDEASDDEDAEEKSPIHGVWDGVIKGLDAMGVPEMAFKMTVVARDDGTFFGTSEADGESRDFDELTFDEGTGAFTSKSVQEGITVTMEGTLDGDTLTGTWEIAELGISGEWEATRTDEEVDEDAVGGGDDEPVVIDLEGFERRSMLLPVSPGSFGSLAVNHKNQLLYMRMGGGGPPAVKLFDITEPDKGERNVIAGVGGFTLSGDGKKMGVYGAAGMAIVSTSPGQSLSKPIPTDGLKGRVDPREEWAQIFNEAWRLQRDFFYDSGLHGVDWESVRERYGAMVADCVTREDLSFVIGEMIAELNVGHAYYFGGDGETTPSENVGMLGCDFELGSTDDGTAYRIAKIYEGAPWDADARGPLSQPGVDIKVGDFLLEVNGVAIDTAVDPWMAFIGLAGDMVELTVSDRPFVDDEARRVLVEPIGSDVGLRYRVWVESKRRYVADKTDGRVGYIYVPNTGVQGQNELFRQFYGQRHLDGLVIDERWNGGGQIPTRFIELLNRPRTNYWARRHGNDWPWPPDSHQGPKVMLINGLAGSGGDMFPALFRQAGLGKLVGMRTWGGLVGISGNPSLVDGAGVTVPTFGFYETDGTWGIEGHGVDPDIEVIDDPALMVDGGDPQLDSAIEVVLDEIRRNPYTPPSRPASPDRSGMGITDADK